MSFGKVTGSGSGMKNEIFMATNGRKTIAKSSFSQMRQARTTNQEYAYLGKLDGSAGSAGVVEEKRRLFFHFFPEINAKCI